MRRLLFVMLLLEWHGACAENVFDGRSELVLRDALVAGRTGRGGRTAFQTDAVAARIVKGDWKTPAAGDSLEVRGTNITWKPAHAAADGSFTNRELRGGYLCATVLAKTSAVALLDASGDSLVYVNGEPRAGDPYSNGILRLPVALHAGTNELLFAAGRGQLKAKIEPVSGELMFSERDATLPDMIRGETGELEAGIVLLNCTSNDLRGLRARASFDGRGAAETDLPAIPALSLRKVPIRFNPVESAADKAELRVEILGGAASAARAEFPIRIRKPGDHYKTTFRSEIDGSLQYYAVDPPREIPGGGPARALFFSTHGASVEAMGQADAYASKSWGVLVAPTNRRPYGFDWEDWGRMDALEVLALAKGRFHTDPAQTYLTGHSMGGHGAWQLGVTFPDKFAAVAPSAGWISFASYAGGRSTPSSNRVEALFERANSPSDTLSLATNYLHYGIYILHGDADDNVPVTEARKMKARLSEFHRDFVYHEQPGAGHWWGNQCVDWPPIFDFFARHKIPADRSVTQIDFSTANPGISASSHWVTIEQQTRPLARSSVALRMDSAGKGCSGSTENVARLALDFTAWTTNSAAVSLQLDGQKIEATLDRERKLHLARSGDQWALAEPAGPEEKGPRRNGPFKEAFQHRMIFVYGTSGTPEETQWGKAKARFDAESWYYRGNGAVDVIPDRAFDPDSDRDRAVILYGNSENNRAWNALLASSPVQVNRARVRVGKTELSGANLACVFCRPRPGSDRAMVAVISGTGLEGLRTADRLPYFMSGVGFPDFSVFTSDLPAHGAAALRAAGFFGNDWTVNAAETAFASADAR